MSAISRTIWEMLDECVHMLDEPFRASEIVGWFRRHYPEVKEHSLRAHIQGATSNVPSASRGAFASRPPLITRVGHGLYRRVESAGYAEDLPSAARHRRAVEPHPAGPPVDIDSGSPLDEWHHEANVQAAVVTHLATSGWSVTSVADTATKEHGIDVVARRGGIVVGIEVKGYPSRFYADPARAGRPKPTQPSTQARVWHAGAVLSAMRLRGKEPDVLAVVALPDFPTYRALFSDTRASLGRCGIEVWWVGQDGSVTA